MRRFTLYVGLATALVASCSIREENFETPQQDDVVYYASFEQLAEEGTRVYVNEDLLLRWTADDRVSIFEKNTYNQQFRFTGATGDNVGGFKKVGGDDYHTGNSIPNVVSVYPYLETTTISESGVLVVNLPAEQHYAENTFGLGDNTMVSVSADNSLQYKNVGGYLRISLYGEGVSISSITLKGNNGEKLAGNASVTMPLDGTPSVEMADDATTSITLSCVTPVQLGSTAEESTQFWFVVPSVNFSKGFTITVSGNGGVFEKSTNNTVTIERNHLSKMVPIQVETSQPNNVIHYTSSDGSVVTPRNPEAFGANIISNEYVDGSGIITFDGVVTQIGKSAFQGSPLLSISIPESVTSIGYLAFGYCDEITSITIPKGVTSIEPGAFEYSGRITLMTVHPDNPVYDSRNNCNAIIQTKTNTLIAGCSVTVIPENVITIGNSSFYGCWSLTSISIPEGVTSIGGYAFAGCNRLMEIEIPDSVTSIGSYAFAACRQLASIIIPQSVGYIANYAFYNCNSLTSISLPSSIVGIGMASFGECNSLTSITIPANVARIGRSVFQGCSSLTAIIFQGSTVPSGDEHMFDDTNDCPIYVPSSAVKAYKAAAWWSAYANRIQAVAPLPEAVDLGLPSGVKWASFNLGASKPEEYGDYYAWGETEPYYSRLDPLKWKNGKEKGYDWPSYQWCKGTGFELTKYCDDPDWGYDGFNDNLVSLEPEDDAAYVNLGGKWRMPTIDEEKELRKECSWDYTTLNGINGHIVTGPNGNSIFMPAAGRFYGTSLELVGSEGYFWSVDRGEAGNGGASFICFEGTKTYYGTGIRSGGRSIRPVCSE